MSTVSSFYGLQTSLRGLLAQQRALDVTSHNIANASTVGYSRQEATMAASVALPIGPGALQNGAGAQLGSGVDIQSYRRVRDGFLDVQFRAQATKLGEQQARSEALDRAEMALSEPGDSGINTQLTEFWSAWSDLANAPDDVAARQAVIQKAGALADTFKTVDSQLALVATQAADELTAQIGPQGDIANIATELAQLNETIKGAVTAGQSPNDLLDRRDVLLDQLSALGTVSVQDEIGADGKATGAIDVRFGDPASPIELVSGREVTTFPLTLSGATGGRLGALREVSRPGGTVEGYRDALDQVASSIAGSVNGAFTAAGLPPFFSTTPGSEAGSLSVAVDASTLRTSASADRGANDVALAVSRLVDGAGDSTYRAFVSRIGSDAREATRAAANAEALTNAVGDRRESIAGVSLDEEMTNLVRFQRAYQASARAMSTMDEMLDVLINRTGRVGL
jgi:flagellar hook-associated protein 1 FlgK